MARIIYVCPLVEFKPNYWRPKIQNFQATNGPFETCWTTTSGTFATPWAYGEVELTAAQQTAIAADTEIILFDFTTERSSTLVALPAAKITRLANFITSRVGLSSPNTALSLETVMNQIIATNEASKSVASIHLEVDRVVVR